MQWLAAGVFMWAGTCLAWVRQVWKQLSYVVPPVGSERRHTFNLPAFCEEHHHLGCYAWSHPLAVCNLYIYTSPQEQHPGLLVITQDYYRFSLVARQQVMSLRVSESNRSIRNGFLNVGCTQFEMNLIWMGLLPLDRWRSAAVGAVWHERGESPPCIDCSRLTWMCVLEEAS